MKKNLIGLTTLSLSTITLFSNTSTAINIKLNTQKQDFSFNHKQMAAQPNNSVENWYKFLATNDWKVFITRDTWINTFLAWFGDALIGKITTRELHDKILAQYKSWPNHGNRNFSNSEYNSLVGYTHSYVADISKLIFSNDKINRIVFKTDSDERWVGVYDASV